MRGYLFLSFLYIAKKMMSLCLNLKGFFAQVQLKASFSLQPTTKQSLSLGAEPKTKFLFGKSEDALGDCERFYAYSAQKIFCGAKLKSFCICQAYSIGMGIS